MVTTAIGRVLLAFVRGHPDGLDLRGLGCRDRTGWSITLVPCDAAVRQLLRGRTEDGRLPAGTS